MSDLVAFLRACIAEDEAAAREAQGAWSILGPNPEHANSVGRHALRWDPVRVLAECAAKRAILEGHHPIDPCDAHDTNCWTVPCDTVLALAQPYAERTDFDPAWAL